MTEIVRESRLFVDFSHRAALSGQYSYDFSNREKNSASNEHSLDQPGSSGLLEIHPFFTKNGFSTKIYGFWKKNFRSKERA